MSDLALFFLIVGFLGWFIPAWFRGVERMRTATPEELEVVRQQWLNLGIEEDE